MFTTRSIPLTEVLVQKLTERVWQFSRHKCVNSSETRWTLILLVGRNHAVNHVVKYVVIWWPEERSGVPSGPPPELISKHLQCLNVVQGDLLHGTIFISNIEVTCSSFD